MSYEKLQGHAWAYTFTPFAKKYYSDDPEAAKRLMERHSMFYNTEPVSYTHLTLPTTPYV